jgi:hypothetical protein
MGLATGVMFGPYLIVEVNVVTMAPSTNCAEPAPALHRLPFNVYSLYSSPVATNFALAGGLIRKATNAFDASGAAAQVATPVE